MTFEIEDLAAGGDWVCSRTIGTSLIHRGAVLVLTTGWTCLVERMVFQLMRQQSSAP